MLLPKHTRSKGPSLHRHYPASSVPLPLSDTQMIRRPFRRRSQDATPRPSRADANYLPGTLCSLPWWSDPCCWLSLWRAPAPGSSGSTQPSPLQRRVGTTLGLSRPARALHALRPAKSLAHLSVDFVARFRPGQFPDRTARLLSNLTINYSSGSFPPLVICPFRAHAKARPTIYPS